MNSLAYTSDRHQALHDVDRDTIVFHTVESPNEGFGRDEGGELPLAELHALEILWRSRLIATCPPRTLGDRARRIRRVELTSAGRATLTEWQHHHTTWGRRAA